MPAGKAEIVSHRGARITLAKVIELERTAGEAGTRRDGAERALRGQAVSPEIELFAQRWLEKAGALSADDWETFRRDLTARMKFCQLAVADSNRSRVSYAINICLLRRLPRKKDCRPLTVEELGEFRNKLREAVKRYQLDHADTSRDPRRPPAVEELITLTDRRKRLNQVRTLAARLGANPESRGWPARLAKAIEKACSDKGTEFLLVRALAQGTGERLARLPRLVGELKAAAVSASVESDIFEYVRPNSEDAEKDVQLLRKLTARSRGDRLPNDETTVGEPVEANENAARHAASRSLAFLAFSMNWLPQVQVLANLDIDTLVPAGRNLPDPALGSLVVCLEPLWMRTTGYPCSAVSIDERHLFGGWVSDIVQRAGFPSLQDWSVWTVSKSGKPEK